MVGALINLVGHYFIGLPIGVCLMFAAKMGIIGKKRLEGVLTPAGVAQGRPGHSNPPLVSLSGLWVGLTICVVMQASFFLIFLYRLDWTKASKEVFVHIPLLSLCFRFSCELRMSVDGCDQAQVRAGIQIREEKEMSDLEGTGKFQINPR